MHVETCPKLRHSCGRTTSMGGLGAGNDNDTVNAGAVMKTGAASPTAN
jgi:hypothetical protein